MTLRCDKPIKSLYAPLPEIERFRSHSPAHSVAHHVICLTRAGPPRSNRFHIRVHRVPSPGHIFAHPLAFPSTRSYFPVLDRIRSYPCVFARTRPHSPHSLVFARIRSYSPAFARTRQHQLTSQHRPSAVQTGSMIPPAFHGSTLAVAIILGAPLYSATLPGLGMGW